MTLQEYTQNLEPKIKSLGFHFIERCGCGGVQQYWYSFIGKNWLVIKPKNNQWGVHLTKKGKAVATGGIIAPSNDLQAAILTHYGLEILV